MSRNSAGPRSRSIALLLAAAVLAPAARGATLYWDADGDTTTALGGAGTWGTSFWRSGSTTGTLGAWVSGSDAVLQGTGGTITMGSAITAASLTVSNATFDLAGAFAHNLGAATINSGSGLTFSGAGNNAITFSSLTGAGTLTINKGANANTLSLSTANSLNFTGTLVLRGGSASAVGAMVSNYLAFGTTNITQAASTAFALDTGAAANNAKDLLLDATWSAKTLTLSSLTGYGAIRRDSGATNQATLRVDQATNTTFNGSILSHNNGTSNRTIKLVKAGGGVLTLAGLVGSQAGTSNIDTDVEAGTLVMTANNTQSGTITVKSGGLLRMENASAAANFTGGNTSMTASYVVNSGGELQAYRQGNAAFGTGTITLSGGSLYQTGGSWTWINNIVLTDATSSTFGNKSGVLSGGRSLKYQGVISGSGNLTIADGTSAVTNADTGIVLTGTNTLSGTLTIAAHTRVGGVTGATSIDLSAGTGGTLGTASVSINSGKILTFSRSDTHTVANAISGAGSVRIGSTGITGSGTQDITLSGTNSYAGGTELLQGTLRVTSLANIGTYTTGNTGYLAVKSGATFVYGGATDSTTRNLFLDSGAATISVTDANAVLTWSDTSAKGGASGGLITKSGAGTLVLSGAITSGGSTAVSVTNGLLRLSGANTYTGTTTIASGATLEISGSGSLASTTLSGAGTLRLASSGTTTLSTDSSGFTGLTTLSNGVLRVGNVNALGGAAATLALNGGKISSDSTTARVLTAAGASAIGGDLVIGDATNNGALTLANAFDLGGATRTLTVASNATLSGVISNGGLTKSGNGELTLSATNTYAGGTVLNAGTLSVTGTAGSVSVAAGAKLRGTGTVGAVSLANGSLLEAGVSGLGALTAGDLSVAASAQGILSILNVANYASSAALTVGNITFAAGGTLRLDVSGAAGVGEYSLVAYTGTIDSANVTAAAFSPGNRKSATLNFDTAGVIKYVVTGTQPKWIGSTSDWSGADAWDIGSGTTDIFQSGDSLVFDDTAASGAINITANVDPSSLSFSGSTLDYALTSAGGVITSGALVKSGSAKLTLVAANTYAGGSTLSGGRVRVGDNAALGSGSVTIGGAALSSDGATARSLANALTLTGSVTLGDAVDNGALTLSGAVNLNGANRTLTLASNATLSGIISNGALTKAGNGTLTLSGANTYSDGTVVSQGSLVLGAANVLADSAAVSLASGTSLNLGGFSETIGALTVSGATVSNGTLTASSVSASSGTLSAILAGSGALTKTGNGTLVLSAANTFAGGSTVSAGTIRGSGASSLGSAGTVTLGDAQTGTSAIALLLDASAADATVARAISLSNQGSGTVTLGAYANRTGGMATFSGAITLGRDAILDGGSNGDRTQFTGAISGSGAITISGTNRVMFVTGAKSYTGGTTVLSNAILQLGDGTAAANSLLPDVGTLTLQSGSLLRLARASNETVGDLAGSGTISSVAGANTLTVATTANGDFSGTINENGGTLSLAKSGNGVLTLSGSVAYTGTTSVTGGGLVLSGPRTFGGAVTLNGGNLSVGGAATMGAATTTSVTAGKLTASGNSFLGAGLTSSATSGEVDFGSATVTIGSATSSNQFYTGKLTGTGTLQLRGGSLTIQNADGTTAGTGANYEIWSAVTSVLQAKSLQFFALDTGASLTDRKDFGFINDTGDVLNLSKLSGYGAIRNDSGGAGTVVRRIVVDQSEDSVFNGALLSHRSGSGVQRALSLTKQGNGTLELAGFVGKATASSQAGTAGGVALTVEAGVLNVTNAYNTTTTNTDAIGLGLVTVTGGTLAFSSQALLNAAGTAGATRIDLNGGILRWNTGNTQDVSAGGRLRINDGVIGAFNTNGNDVTLGTALSLGTAKTGGLSKVGNGVLTLAAANTYTGLTTVSGGTLRYGVAGAFGTSDIRVAGGQLDLNSLDLSNNIALTSGTLANYANWTGTFVVNYTGAVGSDVDAVLATYGRDTVRLISGGSLGLSGLTRNVIVSGGSLAGDLSSYTGTLAIRSAVSFATSSAGGRIQLEAGGSIDYAGRSAADTIHYVDGSLANAAGFTGDVVVVNAGTALAAGTLGAGRVVVGAGTSVSIGAGFSNRIRLAGGGLVGDTLNNFAGTLTVAGGQTLDLDGPSSDLIVSNALANITLESGATLKGTAAVGDVTVKSGAMLAPGNSPGMLTATNLRLEGGAFNFEVGSLVDVFGGPPVAGTDYDTIVLSGELDLSGLSAGSRFGLMLITLGADGLSGVANGWDPSIGFELSLIKYGSVYLGSNSDLTSLFTIDSTGFLGSDSLKVKEAHFSVYNDTVSQEIRLVYSTVPEPSTYGLMLGGLALAAAAHRRRRQKAKA